MKLLRQWGQIGGCRALLWSNQAIAAREKASPSAHLQKRHELIHSEQELTDVVVQRRLPQRVMGMRLAERDRDLRFKTEPRFLWSRPFLQQPNSTVESNFADVRNYFYQGKQIDQQVHLGYDLAITQHVGVMAANDGRVVYAAPLGIYGNCIVLDHGYGLQSIYGHLSEIAVHEGDMVKRGQVMGKSGQTGLAGGDHIHFSMQLDGVQIDPKEWWDAHWIRDHIAKRVDLPGFSY